MAPKGEVMVQNIPLNKIKLGKNSRLSIRDEDFAGLMMSIKDQGMLQPIGVVRRKTGYEICYGNRRFLACSKLGYSKIPAIVHEDSTEANIDLKNLTENIQRRNISLTEAGRYIQLLMDQKLTKKEIAARLGVSTGYVESCLSAYNEVPEEYRSDLEVQRGSAKLPPGKISITTAQKIITARKNLGLTKAETKKLYEAAKTNENFKPQNTWRYASALKNGKANFVDSVKAAKHVSVNFSLTEEDYDKLYTKYVIDGPYSTLSPFFRDVLAGKRSVRIPVLETVDKE